jgi:predicted nucleic acid-binding protein
VIVVSDAGPLIHLSQIGQIDLLPALYTRILIPDLVHDEVVKHGEGRPGSAEVRDASWIEVVNHDSEGDLCRLLRADLGPGEAAAITLGVKNRSDWLLSDDRPARLAAERLGLRVRGTLGVLVEAKRRDLIPQVSPLLIRLREQGVWLSDELIAKILSDLGEPSGG